MSCDETTIKRIGESQRGEYGRTLIGLTCQRPAAKALLSTATTMTGGKKSIKERVTLIAKKPKTAVATLLVVILLLTAAVGCTFTGAKAASPDEPEEDINEPVEETDIPAESKRETIFESDKIKITVPKEYADLIKTDTEYSDNFYIREVNLYYSPEYHESDNHTACGCGGWIMSVISQLNDPMRDLSNLESGIGTTLNTVMTDGKRIYIEEYPVEGEYHYKENPESAEIYESILNSLEISYLDLTPYAPPSGLVRSISQPLTPENSHDFVKAELYLGGGVYTLEDKAVLDKLAESFASMTEMGFIPGCPFSSTLLIESADGKVFELKHAEDSCNAFYTGGKYYDYAPDYGTADFFKLFGIAQYHEEDELDELGRVIKRTAYYWDEPGDVWEWFYDGDELEKTVYVSADKSVKYENFFEYNEKGAVRKEVCYYNGSTERSHEYEYYESGAMKETRTYDESGELYIIVSYTYYNDWRIKEKKLYYPKDDSGYIEKYTYEDGSDEPKVEMFELDGVAPE